MAETTLTPTQITRTGVSGALAAANADGSKFRNTGREFLHFKNTDGSGVTVTVVTQKMVDSLSVTDLTLTVPATTGDKAIGPFPPEVYNDSDGYCHVTYSAVTALTVAAFRL